MLKHIEKLDTSTMGFYPNLGGSISFHHRKGEKRREQELTCMEHIKRSSMSIFEAAPLRRATLQPSK